MEGVRGCEWYWSTDENGLSEDVDIAGDSMLLRGERRCEGVMSVDVGTNLDF